MRHQNQTPTRRDDIYETKTGPQRDETIFMRPKLDPNETRRYLGHIVSTIRYDISSISSIFINIWSIFVDIPSIFPQYSLDIPSISPLPPSLPPSGRPQRDHNDIWVIFCDTNETPTIFGSYFVTPTRHQREISPQNTRYWGPTILGREISPTPDQPLSACLFLTLYISSLSCFNYKEAYSLKFS